MLTITVPAGELFNEKTNEFVNTEEQTLELEHSLISLAKWESKWCKSFFSKEDKTYEETIDYIRCMTLTKHVKPETYYALTADNIKQINEYNEAPMTATVFYDKNRNRNRETITSELIYYWMIAQNIPFECQKWHINRLLTLIRMCNVQNTPPKKRSRKEVSEQYASLNAARRAKLNSKG